MKRNDEVYTGLNSKKEAHAYHEAIKKSWMAKNIIPVEKKRFAFIEKIIKFFIMIILKIVTPRQSWKNKSKTEELINRTYTKFTNKDFAFIPISTAFYFLVSFVPIITTVDLLLMLIKDYDKVFLDVILAKIIPGAKSLLSIDVKATKYTQNVAIIILILASTWLASAGFSRFVYSQNYIYNHEHLGNWFTNRLKGFMIMLSVALYMFLTLALYIFFYNAFTAKLSEYHKNIYFYITFSVFLFITFYLGFILLYKITPNFKLPWNLVLPGAMITTVPLWIFFLIFGYLTSLIDYNKYGVIGIFMYIAMLVSYMSYFMYLGIIANEAYYKTYYSSYTVSKKSIFFGKMKF